MARQPADAPPPAPDERRRHPRVPIREPGVLVSEGVRNEFEMLDISESGVRLRSRHAIHAMTQLELELRLAAAQVGGTSDYVLKTTGIVVWSHKQAAAPLPYDTGVFFPNLDDRQREVLRTMARTHA